MTNTITKITYDWNDYIVWEGYTAGTWISISASNEISNSWVTSVNGSTWAVTVNAVPNGWTDWQVLSKVSWSVAWATPSGWDVLVSDQANNILTSGMKIWCGEETDYANLWTRDNNTIYLTIPDQS